MKAFALALAVLAFEARAQGPGSELGLLPILGPPVLASVALDLVLLSTLVGEGTAKRGGAITTMVFGTIGMMLSGLLLAVGLGSPGTSQAWTGLNAGALAIETGTLVVGVYGLIRGEGESEPEPPPQRVPKRLRPPPEPEKEMPPQL
jgi:hypothetical protein